MADQENEYPPVKDTRKRIVDAYDDDFYEDEMEKQRSKFPSIGENERLHAWMVAKRHGVDVEDIQATSSFSEGEPISFRECTEEWARNEFSKDEDDQGLWKIEGVITNVEQGTTSNDNPKLTWDLHDGTDDATLVGYGDQAVNHMVNARVGEGDYVEVPTASFYAWDDDDYGGFVWQFTIPPFDSVDIRCLDDKSPTDLFRSLEQDAVDDGALAYITGIITNVDENSVTLCDTCRTGVDEEQLQEHVNCAPEGDPDDVESFEQPTYSGSIAGVKGRVCKFQGWGEAPDFPVNNATVRMYGEWDGQYDNLSLSFWNVLESDDSTPDAADGSAMEQAVIEEEVANIVHDAGSEGVNAGEIHERVEAPTGDVNAAIDGLVELDDIQVGDGGTYVHTDFADSDEEEAEPEPEPEPESEETESGESESEDQDLSDQPGNVSATLDILESAGEPLEENDLVSRLMGRGVGATEATSGLTYCVENDLVYETDAGTYGLVEWQDADEAAEEAEEASDADESDGTPALPGTVDELEDAAYKDLQFWAGQFDDIDGRKGTEYLQTELAKAIQGLDPADLEVVQEKAEEVSTDEDDANEPDPDDSSEPEGPADDAGTDSGGDDAAPEGGSEDTDESESDDELKGVRRPMGTPSDEFRAHVYDYIEGFGAKEGQRTRVVINNAALAWKNADDGEAPEDPMVPLSEQEQAMDAANVVLAKGKAVGMLLDLEEEGVVEFDRDDWKVDEDGALRYPRVVHWTGEDLDGE